VINTHQNVVRLFAATNTSFAVEATDNLTLFHSCAFDFSVWELWVHCCTAAAWSLCRTSSPVARSLPSAARRALRDVLNQTPSAFYGLMQVDEAP